MINPSRKLTQQVKRRAYFRERAMTRRIEQALLKADRERKCQRRLAA